ncbi:hypothetical protein Tco_0783930 [Tanacetum coccineum]
MGDANPIRTLGDYSRPSHEGYRNTIDAKRMLIPRTSVRGSKPTPQGFFKTSDGNLCDRNVKESWALLNDLALYDNESWNDPRDFAKPVKAISLPQDVLSTSDRLLIELENQVDDTSTHDTAGNPMAQMNFASTNYPIKEELRGKGIKNPSKLLSSKYLKEDEAKEERSVESSATEYKNHEITVKAEEVESEVEFEEETEEEIKEEDEDNPGNFDTFPTMKELRYHEWLLKNPRPP